MTEKKWLNKLKPFVAMPLQWNAFEEMLQDAIATHQRTLEQAKDPIDLYKAQGSVIALRKLAMLKDEINAAK